jgi:CYTH domain-containing protein/thymidylate kinase
MIKKIVLTGGPCSGKTTALAVLKQKLEDFGFVVYCVPEAATTLILGGMNLANLDDTWAITTQTAIAKLQMATENVFMALAKRDEEDDKNVAVICDRGVLDSKAFVSPDTWQATLDLNNWHDHGIMNNYDAVIHLVSVAVDKPEYYTLENNKARQETAAQAAAVDERLKSGWTGHPHLRVIDNSTDFEGKIARTLNAVTRVLGHPEPIEDERKYLVGYVDRPRMVNSVNSTITQDYLKDGSRVRRRGQDGRFTYTHTIKGAEVSPGKRPEYEKIISAREWLQLLKNRDPLRNTITKVRACFLYNNQYFELDTFIEPHPGLMLLEIELDTDGAFPVLPPWITLTQDVTGDSRFSNSNLALKEGKDRLRV